MKIIRVEISGFGHFRQKTIEFSEGNQLFFGENEAGKSTLYHFIQTMLFGFSQKSKKSEITRRQMERLLVGSYGFQLMVMRKSALNVFVPFNGGKRRFM